MARVTHHKLGSLRSTKAGWTYQQSIIIIVIIISWHWTWQGQKAGASLTSEWLDPCTILTFASVSLFQHTYVRMEGSLLLSEEERSELVSHMGLLNTWVETKNKLLLHDSPAQERQQLEMRSMGRASGVHKSAILCKRMSGPR